MKYTVRYTSEGARESEIEFKDGSIYRSFFKSMRPVQSEMKEIIRQILQDYGIDPDGYNEYAEKINTDSCQFNPIWEGVTNWNLESVSYLVQFLFVLEKNCKRVTEMPPVAPHQMTDDDFVYTEEYVSRNDGLEICQRLKFLDGVKVYGNFYPRDKNSTDIFEHPMKPNFSNASFHENYYGRRIYLWGVFGKLYNSEGRKNEALKKSISCITKFDFSHPRKQFFPTLFRNLMKVEKYIGKEKEGM